MSLKLKLVKKIYENENLSSKDKIIIIERVKKLPQDIIENILIEGLPTALIKQLGPAKTALFNKRLTMLMKKGVSEQEALRLLGIK